MSMYHPVNRSYVHVLEAVLIEQVEFMYMPLDLQNWPKVCLEERVDVLIKLSHNI